MTYQTIKRETEGKAFPLFGENEKYELVVIIPGEDEAGKFFKVNTCQTNGWIRTNLFYEKGDTCELYHKSLS